MPPRINSRFVEPDCDVAALLEGYVVGRPVLHLVLGLVLRGDLALGARCNLPVPFPVESQRTASPWIRAASTGAVQQRRAAVLRADMTPMDPYNLTRTTADFRPSTNNVHTHINV